MKNLRIPYENVENHTNPELYVTFIKTIKVFTLPCDKNESH